MSPHGSLDDDAVHLLRALSGPFGIHASGSTTASANYRAVYARDAVMAGIAGLLLEDDVISRALVRTLEQLRALQGPEGQIASNYEIRAGQQPVVSFGTLAPRIDSATWYLLGVAFAAHARVLDPEPYRDSVRSVVRLLAAVEYNGRHLMYIPPGGNWADEYICDGYVLYDQVLRAWALRLLGALYADAAWTAKAGLIQRTIADRYWPNAEGTRRVPLASFSPVGERDVFDLAACSLLSLAGIDEPIGDAALDWIGEHFLHRAALPPAFHPVIDESHPEWPALRRYHLHDFRNRPHEYHNGGIWPIWLGWLALALAHRGRRDDLDRLRQAVQERLGEPGTFSFEEFLHGLTGEPGGMGQMAYSATGLTFLRLAGSPRQLQLFAP